MTSDYQPEASSKRPVAVIFEILTLNSYVNIEIKGV
jgi:hypothetical protein